MRFYKRKGFWLSLFILFAIIVVAPLPDSFVHPKAIQTVQILDRKGQLLYEVRPPDIGSHQFLKLEDMPAFFLQAVVSIEDRDFYKHSGISVKGITRAALQNLSEGRVVSGGSTITQQLVRNRLQPKSRNILYKIF